jgi:hypothetical protein
VKLAPAACTYIQNSRRHELAELESNNNKTVSLQPDPVFGAEQTEIVFHHNNGKCSKAD